MSSQNEIRERVSNEIVTALEQGVSPWRRPWLSHNAGLPVNVVSNRRYSGVNICLLELHRLRRAQYGVQSKFYATFRQWHDLGCRIKPRPQDVQPGKWGCGIVYCRPMKKIERAADGEESETEYLLLRNYT